MTAPSNWDLLDHFRQDAVVAEQCTTHIQYHTDRARGIRRERVEKKWFRQKEIGHGSCGTVWLEVFSGNNDVVEERAVKIISKSLMKHLNVDYKKELLALTKFSKQKHQQEEVLVTFYGWFEDAKNLFLTMEYFRLGDLENHISDSMTENDIKDITTDVLNGLRIMHSENFAHRDVKPSNIFVVQKPPNSRWWVKIGDFGISKRAQDDAKLLTQIGTPGYQAPEVCGYLETDEPTSVYDKAVDIWSLGCVIYKISTHALPFSKPGDILKFCSGRLQFPEQALSVKMDMDGVNFVKSLIVPIPQKRLSAESALKASWLVQRKPDVILQTTELTSPSTPKPRQTSSNIYQDKTTLYSKASEIETMRVRPMINTTDPSQYSDPVAFTSYVPPRIQHTIKTQTKYLVDNKDFVKAVAFSLEGELVALASSDRRSTSWQFATGIKRNNLEVVEKLAIGVNSLIYGIKRNNLEVVENLAIGVNSLINGNMEWSPSCDMSIRIWDSATGAPRGPLETHSEILALGFFTYLNPIEPGSANMTVAVWDSATGVNRTTLEGNTSRVTAMAFSSDCMMIAFAHFDTTVRLQNFRTGAHNMLSGHSDRVTAMSFSPDCKLVASASRDMTIKFWKLGIGKIPPKTIITAEDSITALAFSPDGNLLASGCSYLKVVLWDPVTGSLLHKFGGYDNCNIMSMAFSPDGNLLASASDDGIVRIWVLDLDAMFPTRRDHRDQATMMISSAAREYAASTSHKKSEKPFSVDLEAGKLVEEINREQVEETMRRERMEETMTHVWGRETVREEEFSEQKNKIMSEEEFSEQKNKIMSEEEFSEHKNKIMSEEEVEWESEGPIDSDWSDSVKGSPGGSPLRFIEGPIDSDWSDGVSGSPGAPLMRFTRKPLLGSPHDRNKKDQGSNLLSILGEKLSSL